ncbi:MAG: hypothetical protein Q7S55_04575 [Nanoarchaeota archaeon]|nr:hypothetical protein [Nanoarchaeota archaeon]
MALTKKTVKIIYDVFKEHKAKAYGSLIIRHLRGGLVYKVYFEMFGTDKFSKEVAYIKLVLKDKTEVTISPITKLEQAFAKNNLAGITKFEFEDKNPPKFLYILRVGDMFFDLTEDTANRLSKELGVIIDIFP